MKKIFIIFLLISIIGCSHTPNTSYSGKQEKIEETYEETLELTKFNVGDVVRLKHETEAFGVIYYIYDFNNEVKVLYRDNNNDVKTICVSPEILVKIDSLNYQ